MATGERYFQPGALKYKMIYVSNGLPPFFVDLILPFFHYFFVRRNCSVGFSTENNSPAFLRFLTRFYVSSS